MYNYLQIQGFILRRVKILLLLKLNTFVIMMKSVFLLNSLFFLLVLVGGVNKAIAQTASVTGIITEFTSGEALQGANITLKEQVENGATLVVLD